MTNETSKVLTLVFTDLADSTALKREHGDHAVGDIIARHREYVTRIADESSGRVIDWAGDGCFLTFDTSSAGVMFALRLQQAHAEDENMPGVRIGLHMGEVTEKEGPQGPNGPPRIEGLAVDLAARIQSLARPGQVLMSSSVYQSARQRLGVEAFGAPILWQAHGDYSIKGFDDALNICEVGLEGLSRLAAPEASDKAHPLVPIVRSEVEVIPPGGMSPARRYVVVATFFAAIVAVALGTDYIARRLTKVDLVATVAEGKSIRSLAVLPLDSLSSQNEQDYFADSMTEAITAELGKIKALQVRGRTTAMQYKDSKLSIPEIARELNVDALIEGSVTRVDDEVRITVQLIHGATDTHLLVETYNETTTNVLKLQSDVALAIADAIKTEVTGEERTRIATTRTVDPRALNAYLLGEHFLDLSTAESISTAIEYFEEATQIDPQFAEAWAELAAANLAMPGWGEAHIREYYSTVTGAYARALAIDDELSGALTGLAIFATAYDYDWSGAETGFLRAIHSNPSNANSLAAYAWFLASVGQTDKAIEHAKTALELDPVDSYVTHTSNGVLLASPDEAELVRLNMERRLGSNSDFVPALDNLQLAYLSLEMYPEAIQIVERMIRASDGSAARRLDLIGPLVLAGREAEAGKTLDNILQTGSHIAAAEVGWACASLGRLDDAFQAFERGFEERDLTMVALRTGPYVNYWIDQPNMIAFRNDPRYWNLIERMKFPPLPPEHPGYAHEKAWLARKAAAEE